MSSLGTVKLVGAAIIGAATVLSAVVVGVYYTLQPLRDDIAEISDQQEGYPAAIRLAVEDTLGRAVEKDGNLKITIQAELNDKLVAALQEQSDALNGMRKELVKELRAQTNTLSAGISRVEAATSRLDGQVEGIMYNQKILMHRMLGEVPKDPKAYWHEGIWEKSKLGALPTLVMDRGEFEAFQKALGAGSKEGSFFRIEKINEKIKQ